MTEPSRYEHNREGKTTQEIAAEMNLSKNTVINIERRAMEFIRTTRPDLVDHLITTTEDRK